jgi:hypothetical protein
MNKVPSWLAVLLLLMLAFAAPITAQAPTAAKPCCETLRLNPIFCCLEKLNRTMMAATCQVCGTGGAKR